MEKEEFYQFVKAQYATWKENHVLLKQEDSIPHIIHHIWIGSPLPEKYLFFIDSMKRLNPSWEFRFWTEAEILALEDFSAKDAFLRSKSYGVKSDIARYEILYQYGGFYFDTDFECIRPLEELADNSDFLVCTIKPEETNIEFANGVLAAKRHHPILKELKSNIRPIKTTEMMDIITGTGPGYLTDTIRAHTEFLSQAAALLPSEYFFPIPSDKIKDVQSETDKNRFLTENSYGIHYWEQSWFDFSKSAWLERKFHRGIKKIKKLFGKNS